MKTILILLITLSLYSCKVGDSEDTTCPCTIISVKIADGDTYTVIAASNINYANIYGDARRFKFNTMHLYNIGDTIK